MKRFLVSILALLYLAASAGFTLRAHYCMGQMTGASIEHAGQANVLHRCERCGMEKKNSGNGCCKDKVKTFRSSPEQTVVKALSFGAPPLLIAVLPPAYPSCPLAAVPLILVIPTAPVHGPPLQTALPRYLRMRNIRI